MGTEGNGTRPVAPRRHGFHSLPVKAVVAETDDARSIVFDVPPDSQEAFSYRAGQFVTVRIVADDGESHLRSYSMSSCPETDRDLQVTVKRVAEGVVSNWLHDRVGEGDPVEVAPPAGSFLLDHGERDIIAFAAGSGITPVFSILKSALATTGRRFRLLYANRDRSSTIFAEDLDSLSALHPDRLEVQYHFDEQAGFVDGGAVSRFIGTALGSEFFICGPGPFMDTVDATLMWSGVRRDRVHIERFTPLEESSPAGLEDGIEVVITLGSRTVTAGHRSKATILHTARSAGLRAPSSCETGGCATCMARVVEGKAEMRRNEVLTAEEITDGLILTCQAVPVTPRVKVVYE